MMKSSPRVRRMLISTVLLTVFLTACGGGGEGNSDDTTPIITKETITVMTYNILNGAGVETLFPGNKEWVENHGYPGNRLQQIMDVISYANPDILGIQEAHQWELGDPPVVQGVADQLGMNYFFGESTNPDAGFCSAVLFTKFDILESESYPDDFTRAALRVKIGMPDGQLINVFVAHLDSNHQEIRTTEASFIVSEMAPYIDDLSIIMGDMNFAGWSSEADIFYEAGWSHPLSSQQGIDQIWTSPKLEFYVRSGSGIPSELTLGASDHNPVVVQIGIREDWGRC